VVWLVIGLSGAAIVVAYFATLLLLYRHQERIAYQPPRVAVVAAAERAEYESADGTPLFAYVIGERDSHRPILLAFHGNADVAAWFVPWAEEAARRLGVAVVLPEYRGYSGLPSVPSYRGIADDALAALRFVRSADFSAGDVHYFGHSLGSAIAAELATAAEPRSLILQSPFSTARAMGSRIFPGLGSLWHRVSRVHYDTVARVAEISAPVFVAHGARDMLVPAAMGREVFMRARTPGEMLVVPTAGHNDVAEVGGDAYWSWLSRALRPAGSSGVTVPGAPGRTSTEP